MKRMLPAVICAVLALAGCSDRAQELFETAQFEEKQNNRDHARQLYEQIVTDYPDSEQARQAKERLTQLSPAGR
jgi:TolA-binding protein